MLIKCQRQASQGLVDYLAPNGTGSPPPKPAFWSYDAYIDPGITARVGGVPGCSGLGFRL